VRQFYSFKILPLHFSHHRNPGLANSGCMRLILRIGISPILSAAIALVSALRDSYSRADPGPGLAMTFDDGLSAEYTPRLLDLLKARDLKATFFLIGQNVQAHPELVRRIVAEGHEVATTHGITHNSRSSLRSEPPTRSKKPRARFAPCGVTPLLLRPPYGALNKPEHVWIPERLKLNVIYWSVDTLDWKHPGAAIIAQRVLAGARPGAIILQHDIHGQTIDAMALRLMGSLQKATT